MKFEWILQNDKLIISCFKKHEENQKTGITNLIEIGTVEDKS